jgi:restriction endonuclease S subunit
MKTLKVKNNWLKESGQRLDASYHLSDGPITKVKLKNSPYPLTTLSKETKDIFSGNIFKRTYVESEEFGWPYLTGSDMMKAEIESGKFISKKYTTQKDKLAIKKGWILVTCSGTLGNVVFTSNDFEDKVATHDLIRVIPKKNNLEPAFLFAYLASRYGYGLLTQSSYGGVIKHIEPHHIEHLPIPIFPQHSQEQISKLVLRSTELREKATVLLKNVINEFESLNTQYRYGSSLMESISIKQISKTHKRFDSTYTLVSSKVNNSLAVKNIDYVTIKSQASDIFIGPRSKRNYVKVGVPFLSTSEMQKKNPTKTEKSLGIKTAADYLIEKGWILTTRSGTLGQTIYSLPCISGFAVSEDAIRIKLKKDSNISAEYLYGFLKSNIGKSSLLSGSYGSVIQHLNENYIGEIKVPLLKDEKIKYIDTKMKLHIEYLNEAILMENQAIDLVEKEIEQWQK